MMGRAFGRSARSRALISRIEHFSKRLPPIICLDPRLYIIKEPKDSNNPYPHLNCKSRPKSLLMRYEWKVKTECKRRALFIIETACLGFLLHILDHSETNTIFFTDDLKIWRNSLQCNQSGLMCDLCRSMGANTKQSLAMYATPIHAIPRPIFLI
jgi:hypothetical protein